MKELEFGYCKTQTADCRPGTEGKIKKLIYKKHEDQIWIK